MDIPDSAFSSVKKSQLKRWFAESNYQKLSVLLVHGPCGTGKRTSLKHFMRELGLCSKELEIEPRELNFPSIVNSAYSCDIANIVVYPPFNGIDDISLFMASFERVKAVPPVHKRIIFVFSCDTLPDSLPDICSFSLSCINIPRTTDRTMIKILQKYIHLNHPDISGSIDVAQIANWARGDIRHAVHQMEWIQIRDNSLSACATMSCYKEVLQFHPDHVSLKLLCGKEEYKSLSSFNFLDHVNKYSLIDALRKNLLKYFLPSRILSLSQALDALSLLDTLVRKSIAGGDLSVEIFVFLSIYRRVNPEPTKGEMFKSNTREKRNLVTYQESWNSQENKIISASIRKRPSSIVKLETDPLYVKDYTTPSNSVQGNFVQSSCSENKENCDWNHSLEDDDIE